MKRKKFNSTAFAALVLAIVCAAALILTVSAKTGVEMNKSALELIVGQSDSLSVKIDGKSGSAVWSSSDESIVTVDQSGNVKGIAVGQATVKAESDGKSDQCIIYVVEKEYSFDDNIMISIFWPPTQGYITDEQYQYMEDAGINWVMGAGDNLGDKKVQLEMLELCYKHGIHMTVGDSRFGANLTGLTDKKIKSLVEEYRNIPAANGFYMLDEPFNPNIFIDAYKSLKEADPNSYMHLNFLPYASYGSVDTYKSQMNDWLKLCANTGYPQDYLMYDLYPFGLAPGSMNREGFLINLNAVREVGLANDVKTGTYIQSVTQSVAFRSPNKAETRYEINMALAFGVKQLSYFTWFTPYNRSEPFEDGIITYDGKPNPKYEFICELNKNALNIGKTLIKCDSLEVYATTSTFRVLEKIPKDFFLASDCHTDFTVSYLRHKETGRNYCMIVNNDFSKDKQVKVKFIDEIKSLEYVSEADGKLYPLPLEDQNKLTLDLEAGAAVLIALPEGYDYSAGRQAVYEKGANLALGAQVSCDTSVGSDGWYMDNLNDGYRFEGSGNGWKSNTKQGKAVIDMDLGQILEFNRIDLYPAGGMLDYGTSFPTDFTVKYSRDGEKWYTLAKVSGMEITGKTVPMLKFEAVKGRYIRIEITGFAGDSAALNEIEVYLDDGTLPLPEFYPSGAAEERGKTVIKYKSGENIAKGKSVSASSYPAGNEYKGWGWWPDYVCDGNASTGWTSNVKIHMNDPDAIEYCVIDLGDYFYIDELTVEPIGCWPSAFEISVSKDGEVWDTVAEETNSKKATYEKVIEGDHVGRYVMFKATKMTSTAADGYMVQLGEIEVYGRPYVDTAEMKSLMEQYISAGGSADSDKYKAVEAALSDKTLTQSGADKLLAAMLKEVGLKLTAKAQENIRAEYQIDYGPFGEGKPEDIPDETVAEETTESEDVTSGTEEETTVADTLGSSETSADSVSDDQTTSSGTSGGCGSALCGASASIIASITLSAAFITKKRKKQ